VDTNAAAPQYTRNIFRKVQRVFELKWFFQGGIAAADGEVASESVRNKIREIISQEDKLSRYSDAAVAALLSAGSTITMARRTVTKYRESMGILSSTKRRKPYARRAVDYVATHRDPRRSASDLGADPGVLAKRSQT
jgi:hypothetical protein